MVIANLVAILSSGRNKSISAPKINGDNKKTNKRTDAWSKYINICLISGLINNQLKVMLPPNTNLLP
jgi:hypothetical protein